MFQLPLELNGYGYDGYGTCTKPYRNARTKFPDLPCDFNTQSWCMVPGSTYPWYVNVLLTTFNITQQSSDRTFRKQTCHWYPKIRRFTVGYLLNEKNLPIIVCHDLCNARINAGESMSNVTWASESSIFKQWSFFYVCLGFVETHILGTPDTVKVRLFKEN